MRQALHKFTSWLLTVAMIVGLLPAAALPVRADGEIGDCWSGTGLGHISVVDNKYTITGSTTETVELTLSGTLDKQVTISGGSAAHPVIIYLDGTVSFAATLTHPNPILGIGSNCYVNLCPADGNSATFLTRGSRLIDSRWAHLTVENLIFDGEKDTYAEANNMVYLVSGSNLFSNVTFQNNHNASGGTGFLNVDSGQNHRFEECTFKHNGQTNLSGGVFLNTNCAVTMRNCTFEENASSGTLVNVQSGTMIFQGRTIFNENSASTDILLASGKTIQLSSPTGYEFTTVDAESVNHPIRIKMATPGVFTSTASEHLTSNVTSSFVSKNASYLVGKNEDGQLLLGEAYTVTYADGGATGGSVPTDGPYASGSVVTVLDNTGDLKKTDYFFAGWNDGTTNYAPGDTFTIEADTTLTAQWTTDHYHDGVTFTAWTDELAAAQNGADKTAANSLPGTAGSYYLTDEVVIDATWTVPTGTTNLCLNGHGIRMSGDGRVISVGSGKTLNIYDCNGSNKSHNITIEDYRGKSVADAPSGGTPAAGMIKDGVLYITGGYITGGYASGSSNSAKRGGGIFSNGTLTVKGGTICGNHAAYQGGGAYIGGGTFTLDGGTMCNNRAETHGGAFRVENTSGSAAAAMTDGKISYNSSENAGGGVAVSKGSFTMTGGEISCNYCRQGGGINVGNGTVTVGGTAVIRGNTTGSEGGGAIRVSSGGVLTLSGTPTIAQNTYASNSQVQNNIYLTNGIKIVIDALNSTEPIGITMDNPGVFTTGAHFASTAAAKEQFKPDIETGCALSVVESGADTGEAQLSARFPAGTPTVTSSADATLTYGYANGKIKVNLTTPTQAQTEPDGATGPVTHRISCQWYSNTTNSNSGGTKLDGATGSSYTIPTGKSAGTYYYYCEVTATRIDSYQKTTVASPVITVTVNPKTLTPSLTGTVSKTYDGTTDAATTALSVTLDGVIGGETVSAAIGSAAYDSASVGTGKTVTASGLSLTGADAGNYTLSATTASVDTGTITARNITITATNQTVALNDSLTAYADDSSVVSITGDGLADGQTLDSLTLTGDTSAVTTSGTITPSGAVIKSGTTNVTGNYSITYINGVLTVGTATPVPGTGANAPAASGITYGQTLALSTITGKMLDPVSGAEVGGTFAWDAPATRPAVANSDTTAYAWTFTPNDTTNYGNATGTLTVTVTPKTLTPSLTGTATKTYDRTTDAPTSALSVTLGGVETGDTVSAAIGSAAYSGADVGTGITVTASGLALTGADKGNYTLSTTAVSAAVGEITARGITLTGLTAVSKTYDGTTAATLGTTTAANFTGLVDGDTLTLGALLRHIVLML
ncbi:MAG: InlB B-repeat-containing protein, partial [Oscillospiraceae bacterium]|nr:InlB B-repeat-containing protein [Oscillospiraceae bacterium]